jgi:hypothetical protein
METSKTKEAVDHTEYRKNIPNEDPNLHPDQTVSHFAPVADPFEAVEIFKETLMSSDESDEGDWKREINTGLIKLKEDLIGEDYWVLRTIENMQHLLLWAYRDDLENLKRELLRRAEGILEGLTKDAQRVRWGQRPA